MLPPGAPAFSNPVLFNNIFSQNEAFYWDGTDLVSGGMIDLEVYGVAGLLDPHYSLLTVPYAGGADNIVSADAFFVRPVQLTVQATPFRFDTTYIIVEIIRPEGTLIGFADYHLTGASPAIDAGVASYGLVSAPTDDYDHEVRPQGLAFEIGADEGIPLPGDANGDDDVDIADALNIAQAVVGVIPEVKRPGNADVNHDGQETMTDALLIAQYVVGLIPELP
jgi:hypothetical protein